MVTSKINEKILNSEFDRKWQLQYSIQRSPGARWYTLRHKDPENTPQYRRPRGPTSKKIQTSQYNLHNRFRADSKLIKTDPVIHGHQYPIAVLVLQSIPLPEIIASKMHPLPGRARPPLRPLPQDHPSRHQTIEHPY